MAKLSFNIITGDFNGDGYVDATDLQMFGDHWHLVDVVEGGYSTATWNTKDHSTGIYFYKLNTDSYTEIKKMMVTK